MVHSLVQEDKERRKRRAQGLLQLGNIFSEAKSPEGSGPGQSGGAGADAKAQMEEAMMRVMEKRMQADDKTY